MDASAKLGPSEYGPEMSPEPRDTFARDNVEHKRFDIGAGFRRILGITSAPTTPVTPDQLQYAEYAAQDMQILRNLPENTDYHQVRHHVGTVASIFRNAGITADVNLVAEFYTLALALAAKYPAAAEDIVGDIYNVTEATKVQLGDDQRRQAVSAAAGARDQVMARVFAEGISDITLRDLAMKEANAVVPVKRYTRYKQRPHARRGK